MAGTVVIGAGLSGLTAAYRLAQAGGDPLVLEARERVGGRAWRIDVDGFPFDAGGEALDGGHGALIALAGELGVPVRRGEPWRVGCEPELDGVDAELFRALADEIDALAGRIDPQRPQDLEGAGELDQETLASWLAGRGASQRLLSAAEAWYCVASASVPLERLSFFALAAKVAAGATGAFDLRFDGGPSALAGRLAARLENRVRLGAEAVAVEQGRGGVRIVLADGGEVAARRAVVAVPLTLERRLRFDPPSPEHRRLAFSRMRYGDVVKAALVYDGEPDVVAPSLTGKGLVYRLLPRAPVRVFFAGGPAAGRLTALPAERREGAVARFVGGGPHTVSAVAWSEERFTRGSYLIFGPGDLTTWGTRLAEPHGRVHFAGSEASQLPSYMNGAVLAGGRAAEEVLSAV